MVKIFTGQMPGFYKPIDWRPNGPKGIVLLPWCMCTRVWPNSRISLLYTLLYTLPYFTLLSVLLILFHTLHTD